LLKIKIMSFKLTDGQLATISPQAASCIRNLSHPPFANLVSNYINAPNRMTGFRERLKSKADSIMTDLVAKHKLAFDSVEIDDVPVLIATPPGTALA
jgi:hypothetical protein